MVSVKDFEEVKLTEHDEFKWQDINECNANKIITPKTLTTINIAEFNQRKKDINMYSNIIDFVAIELSKDNSGHGIQHAMRVFNNAKKIIAIEGGNEKVVLTSALIHDTIDKKLFNDVDSRIELVKDFLKSNNYSEKEINEIIYIITHISWNNGENKQLDSLNAKIVRDADRLDAIGVMGIIRTIEYGNSHNRNFYDEKNIKNIGNEYIFGEITKSTLSHFYEKLLLLKDLMHTETAKKMAEERHMFMQQFLQEFYSEL